MQSTARACRQIDALMFVNGSHVSVAPRQHGFPHGRRQKVRIPSMTGTAAYRIPDELTSTALTEVKNVGTSSCTNQLRDFYWYANSTGRAFNLIVRTNTILSSRLQAMVDAGVINLEPTLPGQ
jgi:hypothetical protein